MYSNGPSTTVSAAVLWSIHYTSMWNFPFVKCFRYVYLEFTVSVIQRNHLYRINLSVEWKMHNANVTWRFFLIPRVPKYHFVIIVKDHDILKTGFFRTFWPHLWLPIPASTLVLAEKDQWRHRILFYSTSSGVSPSRVDVTNGRHDTCKFFNFIDGDQMHGDADGSTLGFFIVGPDVWVIIMQ